MANGEQSNQLTIFSVGHSNHSLEKFLHLLRIQEVRILVDVRSHPHSRYAPHFDSGPLRRAANEADIQYIFLGRELGGRPPEPDLYDEQGRVLYFKLSTTNRFMLGVRKLTTIAAEGKTAILCSEENPVHCHRRRLLGRVLEEQGVELLHIRGNGSIDTEVEIAAQDNGSHRLSLFPDEETGWLSSQSVLRRRARSNSSDSFVSQR